MRWRRILKRKWWDAERAREIEAYLEIETADNIARGMPPADAARAAHRKFGNRTLVREEIYRMNTAVCLESIWQDLRYAARLLRLNPAFALVAIASLALGLGANTAIFQLLDAVRLRSLPVRSPGELAEVRIAGFQRNFGVSPVRYGELTRPVWQLLRDRQQAFSGTFAWTSEQLYVGKGSELRHAGGLFVSGDFFRVLGVGPWRGRLLLPEDERSCPVSRAVVSYTYWQRELGGREFGSPDAAAKLLVNGDLVEIVGVTPPGFYGLAVGENFDIALPFCQPKELRRDYFEVVVMGRLKPGWTIQRAAAEVEALSPGIFEATTPAGYSSSAVETYRHFRLSAYPASSGVSWLRQKYDGALWLLLGITGLVLLIACANLANLMLARASARQREIAVRLALGASRGRLVRQLLAESALLAATGASLGIGLAQSLSALLVRSISPEDSGVDLPLVTGWRVLLFTTAVAALTCALFAVVPALRATRIPPHAAMKSGGRGLTSGRERFSLQRLLVAAQIAVSLVLLVGALLFVRSFRHLMTLDPGMRESGIAVAFVGFDDANIPRERWPDFQRQLLEEVRAVPGILNAATTTNVPLVGGSWTLAVRVGSAEGSSKFTWVSPGYFETMGIPIVKGRGFHPDDTGITQRVAIVNETFIRRYLAGANPVGRTLSTTAEPNYPSTVYEIVGVIPDTKYGSLRAETPPMAFAPAPQYPAQGAWTNIMIYAHAPPAAVIAAVKHAIAQKHPEIVIEAGGFQQWIRDGMVQERMMAWLSGFFGLLAAVLAMIGLYGVISYIVARRRNEIGIRLALGAERGQVIGMVMREAVRLLVAGIAVGLGLALVAGRAARTLLFELTPYDPLTLAAAALLLGAVAAAASFIPARRAARLDPMAALRDE